MRIASRSGQHKNRRINQYNDSKHKMIANQNIIASNQDRVAKSFENDTYNFKSTPNTTNTSGHAFSLSYNGMPKPATLGNSRTHQPG